MRAVLIAVIAGVAVVGSGPLNASGQAQMEPAAFDSVGDRAHRQVSSQFALYRARPLCDLTRFAVYRDELVGPRDRPPACRTAPIPRGLCTPTLQPGREKPRPWPGSACFAR